ncbi:hypothetical protein ACKZDW_00600 (plasmid) [Ralstonia syzygii subsp. celebesensis]|uniref:hypothetical protein n=1 Tax=Ralstonia syzygii TaxID=28097 RepID=UPI00387E0D0F
MSQAQETRKERMWETVHKQRFEPMIAEVNALRAELDKLDPKSPEYDAKKKDYDQKYASAEEFFMTFHP